MWLLKLQSGFYGPSFYDAEGNFSHRSQKQEKWAGISQPGLGRETVWGEGLSMTKMASGANFLSAPYSGDPLQNVISAEPGQVPMATEFWHTLSPPSSLASYLQCPAPEVTGLPSYGPRHPLFCWEQHFIVK